MRVSWRLILCSAVSGAVLAVGWSARADWATARHDGRRTGVSAQGSNIKTPAAYWRARLGGSLGQTQVWVGDANGDGTVDVLYVAGGRVVLADPNGTEVWRTAPQGYLSIVNVVDLDQNGQLDVVLGRSSGPAIVNASTGSLEWSQAVGEIGTPGAYRIGDVDGDGSPELWIDTCGCCAIENGSPGVVYSFATGFGSPKKLGSPPARSHCGASSNTMADVDGDGALEMIVMSDGDATLFNATGAVLGKSGTIPAHAFAAQCEGIDLDGTAGDELLCFTNTVYAGAGMRGLFALGFGSIQTPSVKLLWQKPVSAAGGGDARAPAFLAADLDGDGKLEATVSGRANGAYTTVVYDALTGSELATVDGIVAGYASGSTPKQLVLVVGSKTAVTGFSFAASPPGLNPVWQLPAQRALFGYDWPRARRSGLTQALLTSDLTGDGRGELFLGSISEPAVLTAYDLSPGTPTPVATHALLPGVAAQAVGTPAGKPQTARFFVSRNDGYVALLDSQLQALNAAKEGSSTLPGLPVGGYYTGGGAFAAFGRTAIAGKLQPGDKRDAVLVVDSRGDLTRIDSAGATNVAPAKPSWRLQDTYGAALLPAGIVPAVIGGFRRRHPLSDPPEYAMVSVNASGAELASITLSRPPQHDVLPLSLTGTGAWVGLSIDGALNTDITAMSTAGQQLWQQSLTATAGTQPIAVADWNGDGSDDVAAVVNAPRVYSGKNGSVVAESTVPFSYAMPLIADLGAVPAPNMVLQGCYLPARGLGNDLAQVWSGSGPAQPFPFGALASCKQGAVLVEGTFSVPPALAFTSASGASAGASSMVILASGSLFTAVDAAVAAGATLGQLSDVAISTNLSGADSEPTALVGSTDGYLYAVGACTRTLMWSLAFQEPVGSPILADTDGDGLDEILVSVADGYLYALDNQALPPPDHVWDVDPPNGLSSVDVDDIVTSGTLHASWAAVTGASSYEIAIVGSSGSYITNPEWTDVGTTTSATLSNLPLADGAKYTIGVRAVGAAGKSPDRPSDGVIVHLPSNDGSTDAGGGAGGVDASLDGGGASGDSGPADAATTGLDVAPGDILSGRACTCASPGSRRSTIGVELLALLVLLWPVTLGRRRARVASSQTSVVTRPSASLSPDSPRQSRWAPRFW